MYATKPNRKAPLACGRDEATQRHTCCEGVAHSFCARMALAQPCLMRSLFRGRSLFKMAAAPPSDTLSFNGWEWSNCYSADENYLDLAFLLAKSSECTGRVGCAIVRGVDNGEQRTQGTYVIGGTNSSLFGRPGQSDCHAEANAVAESAAKGLSLQGAAAYVSKPPCKQCYSLLAVAGIARIITPSPMDPRQSEHAALLGIREYILENSVDRTERRERLAAGSRDMDRVRALREEKRKGASVHGAFKVYPAVNAELASARLDLADLVAAAHETE